MTLCVCYCVVLLVLVSCGGVFMINHSGDLTDNRIVQLPPPAFQQSKQYPTDDTYVTMDLPFRRVTRDEFEERFEAANSMEDVLRIFFDDSEQFSDLTINSIMNMKSRHVYGAVPRRAGGMAGRHRDRLYMNDYEEDDEEERELAFEHHLDMARHPLGNCEVPRPEIEYVENRDTTSIQHFYPQCTVVHRCRNTTGCCPPGTICAPSKLNGIQIFEKYFLVLQVFEKTTGARQMVQPSFRNFVQSRVFVNHTNCECQKLEINSNCHKKCPQQFAKRRRGLDCECECAHNNRRCRYMHRGSLPLAEKDLECIKRDECIRPNCATGEFRVQTGFCPRHRHPTRRGL